MSTTWGCKGEGEERRGKGVEEVKEKEGKREEEREGEENQSQETKSGCTNTWPLFPQHGLSLCPTDTISNSAHKGFLELENPGIDLSTPSLSGTSLPPDRWNNIGCPGAITQLKGHTVPKLTLHQTAVYGHILEIKCCEHLCM